METKVCTSCSDDKPILEFSLVKSGESRRRTMCKACAAISGRDSYTTKKGVVGTIYSSQKRTSKRRGYSPPTYTKKELHNWLYSQTLFHTLYDNWKRLDYQSDYKPSVDRKDDYLGYTMANIQLMTWSENNTKGNLDIINGINTKVSKAVEQYSKAGEFIKEYASATEAGRSTQILRECIRDTCNGRQKSAGGYVWKFKGSTDE